MQVQMVGLSEGKRVSKKVSTVLCLLFVHAEVALISYLKLRITATCQLHTVHEVAFQCARKIRAHASCEIYFNTSSLITVAL